MHTNAKFGSDGQKELKILAKMPDVLAFLNFQAQMENLMISVLLLDRVNERSHFICLLFNNLHLNYKNILLNTTKMLY